jgi:hypothetical protein
MEEKVCEPAAGKNAAIVHRLIEAPVPASRVGASSAVATGMRAHRERTEATQKKQENAEALTQRMVRLFHARYGHVSPEAKVTEVKKALKGAAKAFKVILNVPRPRVELPPKPWEKKKVA